MTAEPYAEKLDQAAWHWDQVDRLVREAKDLDPSITTIEIRGHKWPPEPVRGPSDRPVVEPTSAQLEERTSALTGQVADSVRELAGRDRAAAARLAGEIQEGFRKRRQDLS